MKLTCASTIFAFGLLFISCASPANTNVNKPSTNPISSSSTPKVSTPSFEEQAKTEVKNAVEAKYFTKCKGSDSYFTSREGYTEFRNPSFVIENVSPLTEADQLNNVTWKGRVQFKYAAARNLNNRVWSDWKGYTPYQVYFINAVLKNGVWQTPTDQSLGGYYTSYSKVDCQDSEEDSTSGFTGKETDISPDVKKVSATEWEITLPASLQQLDTEKFSEPISVQKGQTITISAVGRVNSSGYKTPNDGSYKVVGANGWSSNPAFNNGRRSPLSSTAPFMALAMRVGNRKLPVDDGRWTLIGSEKTVVADSDGYLHFMVNDMNDPTGQSDWWINNEGGLKIRVQIQ